MKFKKGSKHTEETKIKMRKPKSTTINMKGIPKSEEHKKKQSEIMKKNFKDGKMNVSGINNGMYGKVPWNRNINRTLEEKKHMSEGRLKKYSKEYLSEIGKKARKNTIMPLKDSTIEVKFQNFLKQLEIEFLTHQYMHIDHGYQCDILIPSKNLVIECFGDYWHKFPLARPIDNIRCIELRKAGYKVLVFWEREIRAMELDDLRNKLKQLGVYNDLEN